MKSHRVANTNYRNNSAEFRTSLPLCCERPSYELESRAGILPALVGKADEGSRSRCALAGQARCLPYFTADDHGSDACATLEVEAALKPGSAVVSTAGWRTVTVRRAGTGGETPPEPAGEDACATSSQFMEWQGSVLPSFMSQAAADVRRRIWGAVRESAYSRRRLRAEGSRASKQYVPRLAVDSHTAPAGIGRIICLGALVLVAGIPAFSQSASSNAALVFREKIEPHWFADDRGETNQFWYRLNLAEGRREFVLVNAEQGTRVAAFDHARVAAALSKTTEHEVDAEHLPVNSIEFAGDGKSVLLRGSGKTWKLDLESYSITVQPASESDEGRLTPIRFPHPSRSSDMETEVTFANHLTEPVNLFWIDPDGKRVAYGTLRPAESREQHTFVGHVWLVTRISGVPVAVFEAEENSGLAVIDDRAAGGSRRRGGGRAAPPPDEPTTISPDGRWQAVVRGNNLFLRDLNSAKEQPLTFDANPDSTYARDAEVDRAIEMNYESRDPVAPTPEVYWSPDSKHLVAMRNQPGTQRKVYEVESSSEDQLQPKLTSYPYLKPGDQVPISKPHLFDVEHLKEVAISDALFANPWSISDVRWDPDSTRFTFLFNQRGHQALRVLAVEAQSGEVKPVIDETSKTFIDYSGKFFCEYLDDSHEIIWMSERDGWNHLYLYDAKTGEVKNQITKGEWVVRSADFVDRKKRQIWFQAGGIVPGQDPYYIQYCRMNFDGTGLTVLTEGNGTHTIQFSPDRRFFIDTWSRVELPPLNELRRSEDGKLVCKLEEADAGALNATGWKPPEPFAAKGRDGSTDIYGVLWRPKDFDPAKKYPVIEDIYAGPQDSFTPKAFRASSSQQELADHGFIVVQMDGMGTSNRSKKFHDVCWKNLADAGFPDRILWIKAAAAKYPCMDLARMGIYGTSAGGQDSLRGMLDHGDFYKVCVSDSGCHDNRMDKIWWNEQWMGWPVDESYARSSNVVDAHKLRGKLLLMVGEMDRNVDPSSTMQVVNALIKADKDFDLLDMPGAGHGVARTPYGSRRLVEFFEKNLLGPDAAELDAHNSAATR